MNSNYSLQLECEATCNGNSVTFSFDPYDDCSSEDGLRDLAKEKLDDEFPDDDNSGLIGLEITDWGEVPDGHDSDLNSMFEFACAFAECEQEMDVVVAALYLGVSPDNIDKAYEGEYKDDEDFAQETADSLGAVDKNATWPMNCIDWEWAAKELMYDYSEHNGYYFRNM